MPDEPVDWLFCDMVWRPLEVAQMLGRWARQHQATLLVANFKLPMKRKAEMVSEIRKTLENRRLARRENAAALSRPGRVHRDRQSRLTGASRVAFQ